MRYPVRFIFSGSDDYDIAVPYQVIGHPSTYALRTVPRPNDQVAPLVFGDRLRNPSPWTLRLYIQENSDSATIARAESIIVDAQAVDQVRTYLGTITVIGLLRYRMRFEETMIVLELVFAPDGLGVTYP